MAAFASTLVARESITLIPGHRRISPDPVLEARGVSRRFRSGSLSCVSVALAPGQLIAVTGPANSENRLCCPALRAWMSPTRARFWWKEGTFPG